MAADALLCGNILWRKRKRPQNSRLTSHFRGSLFTEWVEAGEDLNAKLPYLSAYMGHAGLSSTQQYLRLTAEAYPHIVSAMERTFDVFPGKQVEL